MNIDNISLWLQFINKNYEEIVVLTIGVPHEISRIKRVNPRYLARLVREVGAELEEFWVNSLSIITKRRELNFRSESKNGEFALCIGNLIDSEPTSKNPVP